LGADFDALPVFASRAGVFEPEDSPAGFVSAVDFPSELDLLSDDESAGFEARELLPFESVA
jgi:hypothetical protein